MRQSQQACTIADHDVNTAAVAKPALLLSLEQASAQDANLACFMRHKPLTKIVIIVHQLLTSAYPAILHALQVSSETLCCNFVCSSRGGKALPCCVF